MATFRNTFEGLANGTTLTGGSGGNTGGASGDYFSQVVVTGTPTIQASTAQAANGTKSLYINGDTASTAYLRWDSLNTAQVAGFFYFRWNSALPGNIHDMLALRTTSGQIFAIGMAAGNQLQVKGGGATQTNWTGWAIDTWYRVEYKIGVATSTTGSIDVRVFTGNGTTPISGMTYSASNLDMGTANIDSQRLGKQTAGAAMNMYYDDAALTTGSLTMPALPGANVAPTISPGADQYVVAGVGGLSLSGTVTDSDGTVASATWSLVSGPDSPTVSTSVSGSGTSTATASATVDVTPGVYTFQLAGTDNSALAGTPQTMKAYVRPASNVAATLVSAALGVGSTFGSPSTTLVGVSDSNNATGIQSSDNPTSDVLGPFVLSPQGLGQLTINNTVSVLSEATAGLTATIKVYKEDGTTLIDTGTRVVTSSTPTLWSYDLSSSALSAVPTLQERRALRYTLTVTPAA